MPQHNTSFGEKNPRATLRPRPVHVHLRSRPGVVLHFARKHVAHIPEGAFAAQAVPAVTEDGPLSPQQPRRPRRHQQPPHLSSFAASLTVPRGPLFLCERFAANGVCPAGTSCADVHASPANAKLFEPHFRDRPNAGDTAARCYRPSVGTLQITAPNAVASRSVDVAASDCLVTRALDPASGATPQQQSLSACAHFVRKGVCDYGERCKFVHPLVPVFVEGVPAGSNAAAGSRARPASRSSSVQSIRESGGEGRNLRSAVWHSLPIPGGSERPLRIPHGAPSSGIAAEPVSLSRSAGPHLRFRHDPYSAHGWVARRPSTRRNASSS